MLGVVDRYLLRRVWWPLAAVTVVMAGLVSLWQVMRVSHLVLVSLGDTALLGALIADLFPQFSAMALGTAGLFGCVLAYDRLAEDGELTAMGASAMSPARLLRPAWAGGVVLSLVVLACGVWGEPWGIAHYKKDVALLATRAFGRTLKPGAFKNVGSLASVYVGESAQGGGGMAWETTVVGKDTPDGPLVLTARNVQLDPAGPGVLSLNTGPGEAVMPSQKPGTIHHLRFEEAILRVDVAGWVQQETMTPHAFQEWDLATLWEMAHQEEPVPPNQGKLRFHLWQKLLVPWGCLLLCLVGALWAGQRAADARARAYLGSALLVAAYFGLLGLGRNLTIQGAVHPAVGASLGNVVAVGALVVLWRKRHGRGG